MDSVVNYPAEASPRTIAVIFDPRYDHFLSAEVVEQTSSFFLSHSHAVVHEGLSLVGNRTRLEQSLNL